MYDVAPTFLRGAPPPVPLLRDSVVPDGCTAAPRGVLVILFILWPTHPARCRAGESEWETWGGGRERARCARTAPCALLAVCCSGRERGARNLSCCGVFLGPLDLFDCSDAPVKHQFSSEERWDVGVDEEDDSYLTEVRPSIPPRPSCACQLFLLCCAV
jgi:hypothetical protein